jgi:hypothetical protein
MNKVGIDIFASMKSIYFVCMFLYLFLKKLPTSWNEIQNMESATSIEEDTLMITDESGMQYHSLA